VPLHARELDAPTPTDPRVDAMITALEAPRVEPIFELAPEARLPLAAGVLFGLGLVQWRFGLVPLALLSVAFAFAAVATIALERHRPEWARRFER
jgi:hypothetical protein